MRTRAIACLGAIVACAMTFAGIPASAMADESTELKPQYTYNSQNGMTFEKVSHADQGLSQADGVVDYGGSGTIKEYIAGQSETGNGDRGQSYSYAATSYGDWVYIGTMYGGLGVQAILNRDMTSLGLTSEQATALIQTMYAGNMYLGEPDGKSAGGMLFKFNVKTGKTKILMSKSTGIDGGKGVIPTFRSAFKMNGKLYFEGMVMDTNNKDLTQQEIQTAMAYQNGFPCIYEVDPANNDKLTKVYDSVDVDGFRSLVKGNVFTSTRAIGSFGNTLIAGDLKPTADGKGKALLVASKTPSDPNSYKVIADMASFDNLPAIHRQDVNGGGGIYQVQEFNGKLYVVVCTGSTDTLNEKTGTMRSFAIYVGENKGDTTNKADWTWRPLVGDTAKGAKYYYGLDKSRVSAGACTLQVYGDHLYIGDYNDVSSALQGFVTKSNFVTQATNLEQSVNLYRMDKNENVEMLVGDANDTFPKGGSTGLGSGYDNHMNQYTWQTTVHEGKMYLSTMNTTTLLEPIAQFTNGDILNMNEKDWNNTVHYLRVFLRLLWGMPDRPGLRHRHAEQRSERQGDHPDHAVHRRSGGAGRLGPHPGRQGRLRRAAADHRRQVRLVRQADQPDRRPDQGTGRRHQGRQHRSGQPGSLRLSRRGLAALRHQQRARQPRLPAVRQGLRGFRQQLRRSHGRVLQHRRHHSRQVQGPVRDAGQADQQGQPQGLRQVPAVPGQVQARLQPVRDHRPFRRE